LFESYAEMILGLIILPFRWT